MGQLKNGITILVADDDAEIVRMMCLALKRAGYHVLQASNSVEAKARLEEHGGEVPLVIADIRMPGGSGLDLAADLQTASAYTAILYISGLIDSVAVESIQLRDPCAMLEKPFTTTALLARVQRMLAMRDLRLASAERANLELLRKGIAEEARSVNAERTA